jgi:hypothetical protein
MGAAPIHSKKKMKTLTALNQKLLKLHFLGRNALKPVGKSLSTSLLVKLLNFTGNSIYTQYSLG